MFFLYFSLFTFKILNMKDQKVKDLEFKDVTNKWEKENGNTELAHFAEWGSITVLDRMTGFGYRDVETGFRDKEGNFWLASGGFNVLNYPELTIKEAIEKVINHSQYNQ